MEQGKAHNVPRTQEAVKTPPISTSLSLIVAADPETVKSLNLLLAPVLIVLVAPLLKVIVLVPPVNVPPEPSQLPAISCDKAPGLKVPAVMVKSPSMSRLFVITVLSAVVFISKWWKSFVSPDLIFVLVPPSKVIFPVPAPAVNIPPLSSQFPATVWLKFPGTNGPPVIVKSPSISKSEPALTGLPADERLKNLFPPAASVVIVDGAPLKVNFPAW